MAPARKFWIRLLLFSVTAFICLGLLEILIRSIGHYDLDRNFYFFTRKLQPYHLPVKRVAAAMRGYEQDTASFIVFDSVLGWTFRPGSRSRDGKYIYSQTGVRIAAPEVVVDTRPASGKIRIALFGDSFTHGDGVGFENTWGYLLESNLLQAGVAVEVLNFGVSGYGMDQALLRWEYLGKNYSPDIVIFGFQPENTKRNLNLLRPVYSPETGIPFAKPRFILDNNTLRTINIPVLPPDRQASVLADVATWPLAPYEYWLKQSECRYPIFCRSRLAALSLDSWKRIINKLFSDYYSRTDDADFFVQHEALQLTAGIIRHFKNSVDAAGGVFYIVHLPRQCDLETVLDHRQLAYAQLLDSLNRISPVIDPKTELTTQASRSGIESLFDGHYSIHGNRIIADAVTAFLLNGRLPAARRRPE